MVKRGLCILLAALTLLCLGGCDRKALTTPPADVLAAAQAPEQPTTVPETEPPTEAPTETQPPTEPPTEAPTEPPLVLHSGLREDGSFNEGTLFIGDSLTFQMIYGYLRPKNFVGDAKYISVCGSQITAFFDGTKVTCSAASTLASQEFDGMLFNEAAASMGEDATAIYIMWGTNFTKDATYENYVEILDYLLEHCPNATIHLQTVPYAKDVVPYQIINERILDAYAYYQEIGQERVLLLDTFTGIGRSVSGDGVHITDSGKVRWYETILAHAEELALPE